MVKKKTKNRPININIVPPESQTGYPAGKGNNPAEILRKTAGGGKRASQS